jgi:uncharacterized protein YcsI (UPF0317 family)
LGFDIAALGPAAVRAEIRDRRFRGTTAGLAPGHAQANLVVLGRDWADEFREFCLANPRPCPLLDVTAPGSPRPQRVAPDADVRTDIPGYRLYRGGVFEQLDDLRGVWRDDLVAFLTGCSFSFERALLANGILVRHIALGRTVPMYISSLECAATARLRGPMVVSMRPIAAQDVDRVRQICARYPGSHGEPVHVGDPSAIGIRDLGGPDFGDAVPVGEGEVPVFWGCGVTPQVVLDRSGCRWFASHEPGRMFVTDREETIAPLSA